MTSDAEHGEMDAVSDFLGSGPESGSHFSRGKTARGFAQVLERFRGRFPRFRWSLDRRAGSAAYLVASMPESPSSSFPVGMVPDGSSPEELEGDALRFIGLLLGERGDVPEFSSWEEMEMWLESVGR